MPIQNHSNHHVKNISNRPHVRRINLLLEIKSIYFRKWQIKSYSKRIKRKAYFFLLLLMPLFELTDFQREFPFQINTRFFLFRRHQHYRFHTMQIHHFHMHRNSIPHVQWWWIVHLMVQRNYRLRLFHHLQNKFFCFFFKNLC
jgi:hypothetical protein